MTIVIPYLIVLLFGLVIGSFLNVCIHRLPRGESIVWPSSHCPACGTKIAAYDNLPLLSIMLLRGRCRSCQARISLRYPIVELLNGVGYVVMVWQFGFQWPAAIYSILFSALLVVTFIDLEHQIVPDLITLPGIPLGILCGSTILPVGLLDSVLGVLLGGGILWFLAWISPYLFGKEGMGGGDIKLLAMIGAFLGWRPTLLAMMVAALVGSVVGIGLIASRVMRRDQHIPFGPFLALGALVALFFHRELIDWYFSLVGPGR